MLQNQVFFSSGKKLDFQRPGECPVDLQRLEADEEDKDGREEAAVHAVHQRQVDVLPEIEDGRISNRILPESPLRSFGQDSRVEKAEK